MQSLWIENFVSSCARCTAEWECACVDYSPSTAQSTQLIASIAAFAFGGTSVFSVSGSTAGNLARTFQRVHVAAPDLPPMQPRSRQRDCIERKSFMPEGSAT